MQVHRARSRRARRSLRVGVRRQRAASFVGMCSNTGYYPAWHPSSAQRAHYKETQVYKNGRTYPCFRRAESVVAAALCRPSLPPRCQPISCRISSATCSSTQLREDWWRRILRAAALRLVGRRRMRWALALLMRIGRAECGSLRASTLNYRHRTPGASKVWVRRRGTRIGQGIKTSQLQNHGAQAPGLSDSAHFLLSSISRQSV